MSSPLPRWRILSSGRRQTSAVWSPGGERRVTIPTFCAILKMSVWYCFDLKGVTMAKQTIYNAGIYVRLSQVTSTLRKETS